MKNRGKTGLMAVVFGIWAALCCTAPVYGDGILEDTLLPLEEEAVITEAQVQEIPARSAVLMDSATGQLLFEKNSHEKSPPASITKIMTLLLVMEEIDAGRIAYTDKVTCSDHASGIGGSQIWLEPGEVMTVEELIKAAAVNSANDASTALAEFVGGSEEAFVERMNRRAGELGMKDTTFVNPTGLDAEGHLSTAYDIALMSRELLKHQEFTRFSTIWMDSLRDGKTALTNTNRLVRFYEGCTGLKTGTTDGAGSCLSASALRDGLGLIAVTMGSDTSDQRFAACRTLLDYGFSAFERYTPEIPGEELLPVTVKSGVAAQVTLESGELPELLVAKGKAGEVEHAVSVQEEVEAPVEKGAQLGEVTFTLEGRVLAKIPLLAGSSVARMTFKSALGLLWQGLFK